MAKKGKFQQPRTAAQQHVARSSAKKQKKAAAGMAAVAVVLSMFLLLAVGVYAYGTRLEDGKTIYPNVRVAGVEVGGMTASAAQEAVEQAVADSYSASVLEVRLPDRVLSFDPQQTNVALDVDLAIEEAMAYGRSEGPLKAVLRYLDSDRNGHDIELETALQLDTEYIEALINQTAAEVKTAAKNSTMGMNQEMTRVEVQVGTTGRRLDTEGLFEAVRTAFQNGDFTPLTWDYTAVPYETVDLTELHTLLTDQITDAYYDEENHEIVDGVSGYSFDLDMALARLEAAEDGDLLQFPLEETQPELTTGKLTNKMFGVKLESRSSPYVNNPKRTENLRLACEAINGTILNPDEVFSFNDTVGERTEEKGYQPATIYGGDGESVDGVGGGICQVASTIYYTTLFLDLKQVMREPHMYQVDYVPKGMDATVYWDSKLDYKFKNTLDFPIKIQANVEGGTCNITFWGAEELDFKVEMTNQVLETFTEEDVEEVDETKEPGYKELKQTAYTGAKVEAYKKVYDLDGNLLREETILSLYKARPKIYIVGPEPEQPEEPEVDPTDPENPFYDPWFDPSDYPEGYWP